VKKLLGIFAVLAAILFVFGIVSQQTTATRTLFNTGSDDEREMAKQISLGILRDRAAQRAIGNPDEYRVKRVEIDELKMAHTHVQQLIGGVPVWEGEAIVHLKSDGELSLVTDELKESIAVDTKPNLDPSDAFLAARRTNRGFRVVTEEPSVDLYIFRGADRDHLAYRVEMPRLDGTGHTSIPVIFIDAHTGERIFEYNNLQTGSGNSLYSGTVTIDTSSSGSTFYMEDLTRRMGTFNMNNTGNETTGTGGTQSRFTGTDDVWSATAERAGVDAHYGARWTYDYFKNVHGRNGINGSNGPGTTTAGANSGISLVSSRVHFGTQYNNAFWYNNQMSYGDGDGSNFGPLVTLDIAGHEMTHGVTQYTANLTYANESGALNESMSDVFGAMVESYARGGVINGDTWKIGEQAYTPGNGTGDALRYMDNPHLAGNGGYTADDDPDHYAERYTGTADSGGVHINSGIGNKAFYLAVAGGTHHRSGVTVTGMAANDAARIWYRALTVYMTSGTNFSGARTATLNAANDLFGSSSAQYNTVGRAWCAVGVGTCPGGTPTPTPTATPTPGGCTTELLSNPGFEGSASPWVGSGSGYFYVNPGNYPHGGTGYIYFGVNNNTSGQSYQTVSIPSTACGNLTFWLNVTSSETTTTTQYDRLFIEVRNTSGTLLATIGTYSNLNKGTAGVYTQRSASMAAYRGQTVRLQFRATTDVTLPTTFRVDDVSLK
jgi:Zn-dependent metalloprotease